MKKATRPEEQSRPRKADSSTALSLFTAEEFVGILIPLALVGMYWLWEASK